MEIINSINNLKDGNPYLVQLNNEECNKSVSFDSIYNIETGDETLESIFSDVSKEIGVDETLLKAVAKAESSFDSNAVSKSGAMGIMQLMPATAKSLEVDDPFDARQNITGGAKMLAYLLDDYNGNVTLALAAYNAGSGNVSKYGGVPPFKETQNYIKRINGFLNGALDNDSVRLDGSKATVLPDDVDFELPAYKRTQKGSINSSKQTDNNVISSYNRLSNTTYNKLIDTIPQSDKDSIIAESSDNNQDTLIEIDEKDTANSDYLATEVDNNKGIELNETKTGMKTATMDNLIKNDPQSLYDIQACVVSPAVLKLYDL